MPWYKFSARYGPGHQSGSEHYYYSDVKMSNADKEELWRHYFGDQDWPIGGAKIVKMLPANAHQDLVEGCRSSLKRNTILLDILLNKTEHETRHRGYIIKYVQGAEDKEACFFIRSMKTGDLVLQNESFKYERSAKDAIDLLIKCRRNEVRWKVEDTKEKAKWAAIHEKNRLEELARKKARKLEKKLEKLKGASRGG